MLNRCFLIVRFSRDFRLWLSTVGSAVLWATIIVTFAGQVARVEGTSMAPTLSDQDRIVVNKLVYRLSEPRPGDIVMLYYPIDPDKAFVTRFIAKEGDTVRITGGRVFVNEQAVTDSYVTAENRSYEDWGPETIPAGYCFVLGDHRNNSSDSRDWGFVPKKYVVAKVQVRWWPIGSAKVF